MPTAREAAASIWRSALAAGDVAPLVARHLSVHGSALTAGGFTLDLNRLQRILVLGVGKAAAAMARAVEGILGDRVTEGFVVVKDGYRVETARIEVAEAGHPVPDTRGLEASGRLLTLAASANERDLVLVLVSGGGSALTPAPADPITLAEKQTLTRLLLEGGATIGELNAVRKHLSRLKGGGLVRVAAPARVACLALSDVVGDDPSTIASGLAAYDPTTYDTALDGIKAAGYSHTGLLTRTPKEPFIGSDATPEYLAELKVRLPVSMLAKWKTTLQMVAMGFLIVGEAGPSFIPIQMVGEGLLWLAAALTLLTGYDYLRVGLKHMTEDDRADSKK